MDESALERARSSDLAALPADGPRYELIEGSVVVSPPSTAAETALSQALASTLEAANRGSPLGVDRGQPVRIGEHDEVRPDIVVAHVSMAETTPIPIDAGRRCSWTPAGAERRSEPGPGMRSGRGRLPFKRHNACSGVGESPNRR